MPIKEPSRIRGEERDHLVQLLKECIDDLEMWDSIVTDLRETLGLNTYKHSPALGENIYSLVNACLAEPYAIEALLERVRVHGGGTFKWEELIEYSFKVLVRFPEEHQKLGVELVKATRRIELPSSRIHLLYGEISRDIGFGSVPSRCFGAILLLFQLADRFASGVRFVSLLAREDLNPELKQTLQNWVDRATQVLETRVEALGELNPYTAENHLLIQIQPVSSDASGFRLHCWLQVGNEEVFLSEDPERTYQISDVGDEIRSQASLVLNRLGYNFVIELVVKRGVFCHDLTKWEIIVGQTRSRLIQEVPIVFRCLERFEARRNEMKREKQGLSQTQAILEQLRSKAQNTDQVNLAGWREKWKTVREYADKEVEGLVRHIESKDQDLSTLWEELKNAKEGICVSLGFVPDTNGESKDLLSRVLDRGTPIVIWFRETPGGKYVDSKALMQHLLTSPDEQTKVTLSDVRHYIWKVSKEAVAKGNLDDIRYYATLLYDDYDRIPPPYPTNQLKGQQQSQAASTM